MTAFEIVVDGEYMEARYSRAVADVVAAAYLQHDSRRVVSVVESARAARDLTRAGGQEYTWTEEL